MENKREQEELELITKLFWEAINNPDLDNKYVNHPDRRVNYIGDPSIKQKPVR